MAHKVYDELSNRVCPRCKSDRALIAVYHFGTSYKPMCKGCGLKGSYGDDIETALAELSDAYYEWEENQKENAIQ